MAQDSKEKHHKTHVRKASLGAALVPTLSASSASVVNHTPSEQIFADLGVRDVGAALEVLYHSGTLTKEKLWANLKRAEIKNPETIWKHQVTILQEKVDKGHYNEAGKIFFGGILGSGDAASSHDLILSPIDAKRLLVAQAQEVCEKKVGAESLNAFGVPTDANIDEARMQSALYKLGLIDRIDPNGDAKRPLSEFAALVAEKAKNDPALNLEGLMFRDREDISIEDMPSLGEAASDNE